MNQATITYDEFVAELREAAESLPVLTLLDSPSNTLVNDLLEIVDSLILKNNFSEAEKILIILSKTFNDPEFYSTLALVQKKQNKYEEAKTSYEKSIVLDESLYKLYYNYGVLLYEMKDYEEAIEPFKKSTQINPKCELCFYNLGNVYREIENYKKAKEAYENVLNLKPDFADAVYNLGVVEEYLGNRNEALNNYNKAIELDFHNVQAHWNKSLLHLQNGNYKEGFAEYEWRLRKKEFKRYFPFPVWKGEDLTNKKILIFCEQGFGDAIQFVRFVQMLNADFIAIECRKELSVLFSSFNFIDEVIIRDSKIYKSFDYDFAVSIMSLPFMLKIDSNNISNEIYIKADEKKSELWKVKIGDSNNYKIGIIWAGNPEHQNNKYRSINVETLLPYLQNDKTEIYNLQINLSAETKTIINKFGVLDFTEYIKDFSDTAAFIENLDLIICVDTSIAHLAGAMGKETWALLPFNPDWRWLLGRDDSPWYKYVKLFRQKNRDEWNEVLQNIWFNLEKKLSSNINSTINENSKMNYDKKYSEIEKFINDNQLDEALNEIQILLTNDLLPYKAFNFLGILFSKTKNYVKAEEYFLKAMNLKPDFTDSLSNLAIIYFEQNRVEESIELHKKSVEINNANPKSYFNLAYAYQEFGEIEKAEKNYKRAVELNPDFADAQFNLALLKLLKGEYQQTWKAYNEWAFFSGYRTIRNFNKPRWNGENFSGKKLYVYPDQGMGDVIQFVRYLPLVKERGGEVIFECQPALYDLLKSINGFDKIVKTNSNLEITEDYDLHIPLQNLPEIFNTSLETIPNYSSPLKVNEEINQKWKNKIVNSQNYKIGFVWTGNPYPPINRKRHASLNDFIPLFELSGIDFYSLQIGGEAEKLKSYKERFGIYDFTNEIENFEDTAAIINNLDLIITIDTSVAHLAGAMNKKVFTLLPFIPDWRWGLYSSSTPWYPSMKIFRQEERGNWNKVISRIADELQKRLH